MGERFGAILELRASVAASNDFVKEFRLENLATQCRLVSRMRRHIERALKRARNRSLGGLSQTLLSRECGPNIRHTTETHSRPRCSLECGKNEKNATRCS